MEQTSLDTWRYGSFWSATPPRWLGGIATGSNSSYCDSIGCGAPGNVGGVALAVLQLSWGVSLPTVALDDLRPGVARRHLDRKEWRCKPGFGPLMVDWGVLRGREAAALYTAPAQQLRYDTWVAHEHAIKPAVTPFGADHRVFGTYGGFWSLLGLAGGHSARSRSPAGRACGRGSLCDVCLQLSQLSANSEVWSQARAVPAEMWSQEEEMRQIMVHVAAHGGISKASGWQGWQDCILGSLSDIASVWHRHVQPSSLSEKERTCVANSKSEASALAQLRRGTEGSCSPASPKVVALLAQAWDDASRARGKMAIPTAADGLGPRWRLCGPVGQIAHVRLSHRRFRATVLGVWGFQGAGVPETVLNASIAQSDRWSVEVLIFVRPADACVYVDGQRLFQSHPQSYLAAWGCSVSDRGGEVFKSVAQSTVSYSGTAVLVRCHFSEVPPAGPFELMLRAEHPALDASGWRTAEAVQVCPWMPTGRYWPTSRNSPLPAGPLPRSITVCSEVLYGLRGVYRARMVQQWLEYHRMIGVDHFVLYDTDGSLGADGVLDPYLLSGFVTYFPHFPAWALSAHHALVHSTRGLPSHAAPDAQAAAHCIFSQRGLSEWVAFLHSPDEYLSSGRGLSDLHAEVVTPLRPLRAQGLAAVDVSAVYFTRGGLSRSMRASPWLLGRYTFRAEAPIELPRWGSHVAGFLNRFGSPLVDPARVGDLVSAHYPRVGPGMLHLDDVPQDFLRTNHYGEAFRVRKVIDNDNVHDESILWAEARLQEAGVPHLPAGPEPGAEPTQPA